MEIAVVQLIKEPLNVSSALPVGWEKIVINEVVKIIDCKHRTPKYIDGGVPLLSPGTIKWGAIDLSVPTKHVSYDEYLSLMDHCTVDMGDLILSRNQSVGVASYVDSNKPFVLGQDTVLLKPEKVESKFLFYYLQSTMVQRSIFKLAGGSTFSRINLGDIRKLKIEIPSYPEQKKIAKILTTWDKAITTTEKLLTNSQQQKKALMQQLLTGKKRLPSFSGKWNQVKLGECFSNTSGTALEKYVSPEARHHFISIGNYSVTGKYIDKGQRVLLNEKTAAKLLSKNDLVMVLNDKTATGDIIGATLLVDEEEKYIYNQRSERLVTCLSVLPLFAWYLLNSEEIRREVFSRSQGGTQIYVNFSSVKLIVLNVPNIEEQQKIASVLSVADKKIETLQQKLNYLKQEKKALMQQLLTGKRRVKIDREANG